MRTDWNSRYRSENNFRTIDAPYRERVKLGSSEQVAAWSLVFLVFRIQRSRLGLSFCSSLNRTPERLYAPLL